MSTILKNTDSGALLLTLSYSRAVIAPHMGVVADMQKKLGMKWIYGYAGELTPESLEYALSALSVSASTAICPLEAYNWDILAAATLAFYRQVITPRINSTTSIPDVNQAS